MFSKYIDIKDMIIKNKTKKKTKIEKNIFEQEKDYKISKNMYNNSEDIKWIEVCAYKGLNNNMTANIFQENIIPYELNKTYTYNKEGINYSNLRGFHVWKNLYDTFYKYEPLNHCKYYKVKAVVQEKQWKEAFTSFSSHEIIAKEITLVEEIKMDYKTLVSGFEYLGYSTQYRINTIFNTEEKWLDYYYSNLSFNDFVYNENVNKLMYQCKISKSLSQIILNKVDKVTTSYNTANELEKYIELYLCVKKIIDLITLDRISKETILKLLCNNALF